MRRIAISGPKLNYLEATSGTVSLQSSSVTARLSFPSRLSQTCCSISHPSRRADRETSEKQRMTVQRETGKEGRH